MYSLIAVKKVFGGVRQAGAKAVKLEIDEVGPMGGNTTNSTMMIYERSHYTFFKDRDEVFDSGKLVQYWIINALRENDLRALNNALL